MSIARFKLDTLPVPANLVLTPRLLRIFLTANWRIHDPTAAGTRRP